MLLTAASKKYYAVMKIDMTEEFRARVDAFIEKTRSDVKRDLSRLVAVPSVAADEDGEFVYGRAAAQALDVASSIGKEHGFLTENHGYRCVSVLLTGETEREVGIVCHSDVVPAGDGWSTDPFTLVERDGLYIGRGTRDDKGGIIAALYAMKFISEEYGKLPFAVRLIIGSDEERGMSDLPYFLATRRAPEFSFTPDSDYPVCIGEKGILGCEALLCDVGVIADIRGGTADNSVCDSVIAIINTEKELTSSDGITVAGEEGSYRVTATGKTAHAAYPDGSVNAVAVLASYLLDNDVTSDPRETAALKIMAGLSESDGSVFGIAGADTKSGPLTCICGRVFVRDSRIVTDINIRYPVTVVGGDVFATLSSRLALSGFEAELKYDKPPYYFDPSGKHVRALIDAYTQITGRTDTTYTTGGGTYARAFPNTVAFGLTFTDAAGLLGEGRGGPHERDEYIALRELEDSIRIFAAALLNLGER